MSVFKVSKNVFQSQRRSISQFTHMNDYIFRVPSTQLNDAKHMYRIAKESGVLELNTAYCYMAFVEHFGDDGCIIAERNADVVGYVKGYRPPTHKNTIFVWQIGVANTEQGRGLGKLLLTQLSYRLCYKYGVNYLEATVTPSNIISQKCFTGFARDIGVECIQSEYFTQNMFPNDGHEKEDLYRIGPFSTVDLQKYLLKAQESYVKPKL
mmetsp:Transcript_13227/g.16343  ORF Transcript_13227/g.16343 Transcript_13227/m.16343 type:complete len:209 (-) Transcript_13227:233-859(-)